VFPARHRSEDPRAGMVRRHHVDASVVNKAIGIAARKVGLAKRVSAHTFRPSFATHVLPRGTDIRTVQALLGHKDVATTMIDTHVLQQGGYGVASPLDDLGSSTQLRGGTTIGMSHVEHPERRGGDWFKGHRRPQSLDPGRSSVHERQFPSFFTLVRQRAEPLAKTRLPVSPGSRDDVSKPRRLERPSVDTPGCMIYSLLPELCNFAVRLPAGAPALRGVCSGAHVVGHCRGPLLLALQRVPHRARLSGGDVGPGAR
jgi:hypothetical protein